MSKSRRWVAIALAVYLIGVVVFALLPYNWTGQLNTPAGQATETAVFHCGAPWGTAHVGGPASTKYPLEGTACSDRTELRGFVVVDVLLGALGMGLIVSWRRGRFAERSTVRPA